jgi:phosphopantothenoylcysteine decarboxylase/phosphopantothenate--cysteine ligase
VILLIGTMATHGGERRAQRVETFTTTADLREKLKAVSSKKVDAIFHAAAVSDFAFGRIFTPNESGKLAEIKAVNKISTRQGKLLVELVATPKIIAGLRGWFPRTRIVGWKFKADGGRADAISAAKEQITGCSTDLCIANGPAYGEGFGWVARDGSVVHLSSAPLLFEALDKFVRSL